MPEGPWDNYPKPDAQNRKEQGPWTKYAGQQGPWLKYQSSRQETVPTGLTAHRGGAQGMGAVPGMLEPGNINLNGRPTVRNADGSISSEFSTSFDDNGREVLVPTVVDGKFLTPDGKKPQPGSDAEKEMFRRAFQHYKQTGRHLGIFDTPKNADAYAEQVHARKIESEGEQYILGAGPEHRGQEPGPSQVEIPQLPVEHNLTRMADALKSAFQHVIRNTAIGRSLQQSMPKLADALGVEPSETVYSPDYEQHKNELVAPDELFNPNSQSIPVRAARGITKALGGMTSAPNLAMLAGTGAFGKVFSSAPLIQRLVSA